MTPYGFQTFDPYLTFAKGERGFREKLFLQTDGNSTEAAWYGAERSGEGYLSSIWQIGRDAYAVVAEKLGKEPKTDDFKEIARDIRQLETDLIPHCQSLVDIGMIHIESEDGSPIASLTAALEDVYDGWLTEVFMQTVRPAVIAGHISDSDLPDFEGLLSALAVMHVDSYIIASQLGHDTDEAFSNVMKYFTSARLYGETVSAAKEAISANGKRSAKVRHATTNQIKDALLIEWDATHAEYDSRADFARIISAREKMKERTLYDWITAHEKKKTSLSS